MRSENEYPCPSFAIEPARFLVLTATILLLHVLSLNEASEGSPGYYRYPAIHGDTMSHCNFAVNPNPISIHGGWNGTIFTITTNNLDVG